MSVYFPSTSSLSFEDTANAFALRSDADLQKMYWLFSSMSSNNLVKVGTKAIQTAFQLHLPLVKNIVEKTLFKHFCGGETLQQCQITAEKLGQYGVGSILDYSVEGAKDEKSFEQTFQEIIKTIEIAATNQNIPFAVFKTTGIGRFGLLEKIQQKIELTEKEKQEFEQLKNRFENICQVAYEKNVKLLVDAEESWIQDVIDSLAYSMMEKYNQKTAIVYNTFQMYRTDGLTNLKKAFHYATMRNYYVGAKIVRGAYMEKERQRAAEKGYQSPIQPNKDATDNDFDKAIIFMLNEKQRFFACIGTHNEYSCYLAAEAMQRHGLAKHDERFYFAQLYGMSDHISFNLAKAGYNVAKYLPYGPVEAVMPYLFRRAEENTSVAGQTSRELGLIKREMDRRKLA